MVLKVLIVDDFLADREELKEIIFENFVDNLELTGECENGTEVIKRMTEVQPDIIISDIEMPGMNGIELARRIKKENPAIRFIFCSIYNKFEYVRNALVLDNNGYILKPYDSAEVCACLQKTINTILQGKRMTDEYEHLKAILQENRPIVVENFIRNLLCGIEKDIDYIKRKNEYYDIGIQEGQFCIGLIEIDDFEQITGKNSMEQTQILSLQVYELLKQAAGEKKGVLVSRMDDAHFSLIFNYCNIIPGDQMVKQAGEICGIAVALCLQSGISVSAALSRSSQNILELRSLYEQCKYIIRYKYSMGKGRVLYFTDIMPMADIPEINFNSMHREIRYLLNLGNRQEIRDYINRLFDSLPQNAGESSLKNHCFCIVACVQLVLYENHVRFNEIFEDENLLWEKLLKFETIFDVRNWVYNSFVFINEYFQKRIASKNKQISMEVKRFIDKNYTRDINLDQIASELFYSSQHLNSIFKQETGETVFDYLMRFKMEKAKELLADSRLRLYEIADMLGYSHTSYFSNVFRKYTGLTPKEYRERVTNHA